MVASFARTVLRYEPRTITRQCDTSVSMVIGFVWINCQENLTLVDADATLLHVPHGPVPTSLYTVVCGEVVVDGDSSLQILG